MAFGCPICREKLDKLPAEVQQNGAGGGGDEGEVDISAAPCGHMFHTYCIQKWMTGSLASSKQCPFCREAVPNLRCLSLFPAPYDESILEDSQEEAVASGGVVTVPCNHGEMITSLKNQIKVKDQKHDLLRSDYNTLQERLRTERLVSDTWVKQLKAYRVMMHEMETKYIRAEAQLKEHKAKLDKIHEIIRVNVSPVAGSSTSKRSLAEDGNNSPNKPAKIPCPIMVKAEEEAANSSQTITITLDSDSEEEEELRIDSNIPSAPLPIRSRVQNLE